MTAVSVIVPVYNAEPFLERCISSLLEQTLQNIELVFVNDCSSDGSLAILRRYEEKHPARIRVIDSPVNLRQGGARNLGIAAATGDYIGFADADDYVDATMFEKLYQCAISGNYDVVGCHNYVANSNGTVISITKTNTIDQVGLLADDVKRKSLLINGGNIWIKLYRRELLNKHNIRFPEKLSYEDNYFIPMVFLLAESFGLVDEPLYYYCLSENSTVRRANSQAQFQRFETLKLLLDRVCQMGMYEQYCAEFEYLKIVLIYMNTAKLCVIHFSPYNYDMLYQLRNYMKNNMPRYFENKYFISRFPRRERFLLRLNDISPRIYAPVLGITWKLYDGYRRKRAGHYVD